MQKYTFHTSCSRMYQSYECSRFFPQCNLLDRYPYIPHTHCIRRDQYKYLRKRCMPRQDIFFPNMCLIFLFKLFCCAKHNFCGCLSYRTRCGKAHCSSNFVGQFQKFIFPFPSMISRCIYSSCIKPSLQNTHFPQLVFLDASNFFCVICTIQSFEVAVHKTPLDRSASPTVFLQMPDHAIHIRPEYLLYP